MGAWLCASTAGGGSASRVNIIATYIRYIDKTVAIYMDESGVATVPMLYRHALVPNG